MKILRPSIFSSQEGVEACFTESNRERINRSGSIPGLNLGYNTAAGQAEVDRNFDVLCDHLGWERDHLAIAEQVHSSNIEVVTKPGVYKERDGLITKVPGLALGIRVADCAAVLVADVRQGVAGAFHAGWKGAAGNILPKGFEMMIREGGKTENFLVYISPCITQKNFEVGEEVAEQFPDEFVDRKSYDKPHVNLAGFIHQQILTMGVIKENIELIEECTVENSRFFSFRRERERAGRMLGAIKLT
ncbi:MAG: peptidoglycan editing factor PgeF [Balneolaceae bacterium]|nr:MAG: peptidoglycan editing factor PgeF [Balneolaceae bacterium]